ncbi:MAG: potassium channel family protein [Thermoplasmata archaeon]
MRISRVLARVWKLLALILGVFFFSAVGFMLTEPASFPTSIYWALTTLSTVGYGDIYPTNWYARGFAMILMIATIGIVGYTVSNITLISLQVKEEELLGVDGTQMKGHTLLLGWTPVSKAALQELLLQGRKVAVMTRRQESLAEIRSFVTSFIREARTAKGRHLSVSRESDVFVAFGDYSERTSLTLLNIQEAREAIVASDDDARNVMTALILKELCPGLRIVVAVLREQLKETLQAAGVTWVISPSEMGGRLVSAAALQPEVARVIDVFTTTAYGPALEQFLVGEHSPLAGRPFDEAARIIRAETGAILVGRAYPAIPKDTARRDAAYTVTIGPPVETQFRPGDYAIILSSPEHSDKLLSWVRVPPGRG